MIGVDVGGTFTDILALDENTGEVRVAKVPSTRGDQSAGFLGGIKAATDDLGAVSTIIHGTTVATNALLERKGDRTLLVVTRGFRDQLRIAYQARPRLFDKHIVLPEMLYERIEEVTERVDANDNVIVPLDLDDLEPRLRSAYDSGIRAIAIVLMHGYRVTAHEEKIAALAKTLGFSQISTSHATSPMIKFVG
ncbi:MAG: hydantoinase/oxoprolinase N-terminal domain-containing protein, partial [Pseudomonadota bacterium]|nr:hydantoinase/oxoprolinase N-terminal domain-containing protein [Pseudomonadota bacterium]